MPFIGTQPEVGGYSVLDALTASATASYTLQLNSANFVPNTANQLLVSLNGVIQKPGSSFTVSGSTLTFSSALTASDSIDFIIAMGEPLLIGTPSDGTVTTAKIATDAVTSAKLDTNIAVAGTLGVNSGSGGQVAVNYTTASTTGLKLNDTNSGNLGGFIDFRSGSGAGTQRATIQNANNAGIHVNVGTGGSVCFTNVGYTAANALDDYEEGTWTPTVNGLSGAASGYSFQGGHYIKIGQLVFAQFRFTLTNKGSISGNYALIQGLPFNHAGSDGGSGMVNRYTNLANAVSSLGIELGGGTPTAAWLTKQSGTSGTSDTYVTTADIQNNTFMQGTLIYRTG